MSGSGSSCLLRASIAVALLWSLATPAGAGAATITASRAITASSVITVTPTASADQAAPCLTTPWALRNTVASDSSTFKLTVFTSARLCAPIQATAVVYSMPGNGVAWPQKLVETKPFTLSAAGTTEISFAKTCDPVQFDVVTGATPPTISPFGPWHGPLLFPFDTGTAQQYWGAARGDSACQGPPMVLPEVATPLLLPLAALAIGGGVILTRRRRVRVAQASVGARQS